ncbi:MAG: CCA tRNA nucleotidyltransferase [Candidatus Nanohaloarchaeota archaeon QJJ-9]|nr:CCA tRNA nucleotidyltransferase [Candidatus Nanohaloarchaeota archaeon QJJ-9]
MNSIEEKVLKKTWPDQAEVKAVQKQFQDIKQFVKEEFGKKAGLMGSTAKRTFITGDKDLDIFVYFSKDKEEDFLEEKGLEIGKAVFQEFNGDHKVDYAEHPYTKGRINGFEVEIIPVYEIEEIDELKSSVDRTPFHTEWVNENLSEEEKKQVVLLKQFLKGTDLYGSSLKTEGFSGLLCEILIAEYGSFQNLLKKAKNWSKNQIIDVEEHHKELPERLKEKFMEDNLIVIDPTDPERNVASVLSQENYAKFVYNAWRYLEQPEEEYFFPEEKETDKEAIGEEIESRGELYIVEFDRPDLIEDIMWPQLRKLMRRARKELRKNEFKLFESDFYVGEETIKLVFDFQVANLPGKIKHWGPEVFHNEKHLRQFRKKYENVWVEDSRVTTIVEREHTDAKKLLEEFFQDDMKEKGVPENLVEPLKNRKIKKPELKGEDWLKYLMDFLEIGD